MTINTDPQSYINDIPEHATVVAYDGTSFSPEKRGHSARSDYAQILASDFEALSQHAAKGGTAGLLDAEFARYREGFRLRYSKYLHSQSRCVSWFIAGPSNFPAARMEKRSNIAHKRLNELLEFRARALAAIRRTLRPDLRAICSGDADAIERLEARLDAEKTRHERNKLINATIRKHLKADRQAKLAALLGIGLSLSLAKKYLTPDCFGGIGVASFTLSNASANIRRVEQRLEHLKRGKAAPDVVKEGQNARLEDCPAENRIRLFFPGKPDEPIRDNLKSHGFRWTPSLGCWQAYRNHWSIQTAQQIAA
ncbi:hypothetical protein OpiT1DRAFT_00770 [Opitutaceae bacterium TAV1]|nr:hypothetical protein OpiT1DRAFT_00770 [Opitutaceae bacterium TAV1]